ncbi:neurofilament heavy polypeptide isoform X2 [Drosophila ficusphila]|uniref:neurofilament heavy polypeptide isoform X2 n=1 Tax=Drosophila ficusphila TaxID=30025 RepID=UPI0007E715B7|nr:neurofilament heavy polypeptide isoform X2 [Drosophila ficusphila]XP_017045612.1 neurofilament heavy polypeptide isoform X2 [Drosophila ficusphila]
MDIFDMVKAAPPPQTITPVDRKVSTPSPIPPDSPLDSIDLLQSEHLSNEDDFDRKTELDESPFQIPRRKSNDTSQKPDESPLEIPKVLEKLEGNEKPQENAEDLNRINEEFENTTKKARESVELHKLVSKPNTNKKESASQPLKPHKKRRAEPLEGGENSDNSEEDQKRMTMLTKTKAQQKMFSDQPLAKFNKECVVRVRRLTRQEIDSAFKSVANSSFAHVTDSSRNGGGRGRGKPKKKTPLPPKKQKSPNKTNFHIKVPLQNGAKKRSLQHLARTHTPPPSLARRAAAKPQAKTLPKAKSSPKSTNRPIRGRHANQALIQRFGARFFGCVVKIKRTPWPHKWPECSPRPIGGTRKGRSRKPNLSVSFSEAVEILGSNEGGSRRATFGSISMSSKASPKPTRLQRVDATGNVLEDISLTSTPLPLPPSARPSSSSGGSRSKSKRRSCNGSPIGGRLKRPHQRLPLSSLASLRLDDSPKADENEDDDEEYIVPNELPGTQRPGSPPPKRKKISFTTTISDDEDEKPSLKDKKDSVKKYLKPLKESTSKKSEKPLKDKERFDKSAKEKDRTDKLPKEKERRLAKTNEIVEEQLTLSTAEIKTPDKEEAQITQVKRGEIETETPETNEVERDGESREKPLDAAVINQSESDEGNPEEVVKEKPEEISEDKAEEITEDKLEATAENNSEKIADDKTEKFSDHAKEEGAQENSEKIMDENEEKPTDTPNDSPQPTTDQERIQEVEEEVEQPEEFRDLETPLPLPLPLPSTTEENQDDVLEIQTSLDDVRQLHTPSSRQSTPKQRSRLESADSDCSFKSASDHAKQPAGKPAEEADEEEERPAQMEVEAEAEEEHPVVSMEVDRLVPAELPAELMTPPSPTRTVNGGDPASGSSISAPYYSPIEAMPTLDDEVLGQLVDYK